MGTSADALATTRYGVNTTLSIRKHLPPDPFTGSYGPSPRPPVDWSRWKGQDLGKIDRVEFALANPPLETVPPGTLERTLTVTGIKTIRRQDLRWRRLPPGRARAECFGLQRLHVLCR